MTLEQMCRELLEVACDDGLVVFNTGAFTSTTHPQELTAGDLVGMANRLGELLEAERLRRSP